MPIPYSPLRYPGGKGQLSHKILDIIERNNLTGGSYAEPYAGGSGVALFLLLGGHVNHIYINDIDYAVYSFWCSILNHTDEFVRKIQQTEINMAEWRRQKQIFENNRAHSILESGFATFFLNRTNRAGILKGGVIGGQNQDGDYALDCRFNKQRLIQFIQDIAAHRGQITVSGDDALTFLREHSNIFDERTLVYLDPPYYIKGSLLYTNFYEHNDHMQLSEYVKNHLQCPWIVSYDHAPEIQEMYEGLQQREISVNYSVHKKTKMPELMIFSPLVAPV